MPPPKVVPLEKTAGAMDAMSMPPPTMTPKKMKIVGPQKPEPDEPLLTQRYSSSKKSVPDEIVPTQRYIPVPVPTLGMAPGDGEDIYGNNCGDELPSSEC